MCAAAVGTIRNATSVVPLSMSTIMLSRGSLNGSPAPIAAPARLIPLHQHARATLRSWHASDPSAIQLTLSHRDWIECRSRGNTRQRRSDGVRLVREHTHDGSASVLCKCFHIGISGAVQYSMIDGIRFNHILDPRTGSVVNVAAETLHPRIRQKAEWGENNG